ncbi:MAG: hypothetical protein RLZZ31_1236 [Actinomycetota bacterium]
MAFTLGSVPNLSGKTSVITGANSGLGLATAFAFASKGAHVVMAARNPAKVNAARDSILAAYPNASIEIAPLDLASLQSVADCAEQLLAKHERIDILMNNAGLMAMPQGQTADGFETQFGVNHFGHWALTARLMPALRNAPEARVVTVSSSAHHFGRAVDPTKINGRDRYNSWLAYGDSKLANYHFALGLQKHFENSGSKAKSLMAHPGLTNTNLQAQTVEEGGGGFLADISLKFVHVLGMSAEQGALPQIRAATDPQAKGGQFYVPRWFTFGAPVVRPILRPRNNRAIQRLWAMSETATGLSLS